MEDSTADGLAGAGALLAAASLAVPWYVVRVDERVTSAALGGTSGWEALGGLRWLVLALALVAGWRAAATLRPEVPALAALGLLLLVGLRWSSPPSASDAVASQLPESSNPFAGALAESLVTSFTQSIGLELQATWGLGLAAVGAAAALAGTLSRSRAPARA